MTLHHKFNLWALIWGLLGVMAAVWGFSGCTHSHAEEPMRHQPTPLEIQVQELKARLTTEQTVRLLIKLKDPSLETPEEEGQLDGPRSTPSLLETQARFLEGIKGKEVISAKPLGKTPLVILVIKKEGLDRLLQMEMVEQIQEDQPQKPFGVR